MKKTAIATLFLFLILTLIPTAFLPEASASSEDISWGEKKSGVYSSIHPFTLNWSGDVLSGGGLNLDTMKVTPDGSKADLIINQYGAIGAAAILQVNEELEAPTNSGNTGFTNSLDLEQGAVYLIIRHDGTFAKISIDRIIPDGGAAITKVSFSYVLENPQDVATGIPEDEAEVPAIPDKPDLGSPAKDKLNPYKTYTFEGEGGITIPWGKAEGDDSWDIYRSDNGEPYVQMTDFKLTVPEYTDNYVFPGHTYLYKVVAYAKDGTPVYVSSAILVTITEEAEETAAVNTIQLQLGSKKAYVNKTAYTLEVAPFIHDGRTLVPLRFISEALGANVQWNETEKRITLTLGNDAIKLYVDQSQAQVNGKSVMLDVPPKVFDGNTMVPVRFIGEQFNQKVNFNDQTYVILIEGPAVSKTSANKNDSTGSGSSPSGAAYFIGKWDMWVPAGSQGVSGGTLEIKENGEIAFYWNGPQTGEWEWDEKAGVIHLYGYKSGWDWDARQTKDGITVSTFGVHEFGTRKK